MSRYGKHLCMTLSCVLSVMLLFLNDKFASGIMNIEKWGR